VDPNTSKPLGLNIKASYNLGFMLAHRTKMQHIPKQLVQGFEMSIERQSNNEKDWGKIYNNPKVGISFLATGTGNYDIMGTGFGLNCYLLFPLVNTEKFKLKTSWGWGLGWITKKFEPQNNYENNTIGSHINLFAAIKLMGEYYFSPKLAMTFGVSFHHWSNSAFKYPNLGLNLPSANLGFIYKFRDEIPFNKLSKVDKKKLKPREKGELTLISNLGFKAYSVDDNSTYSAYSLELNYARLWSSKWKLSGGVDLIYNTAYAREIEISVDPSKRNNSAFQSGLNLTYHQTIGSISILLGMGAYVIDNTLQNEVFYHKFGSRFLIKDRIIISTVLFTHWARADHMRWGIGYKFKK
jgi:hypothetical protein|tara:strand:+ start:1785 stop:2843 length:1059 start_codon:yes stop_codon:yes gene_type:complete